MEKELRELKARLLEIDDLGEAGAVLGWDQQTYMPKKGAAARGRQSATLSRLAHEKRTDPGIGRLLDRLQPWAEGLGLDSDEAALIRVTRREFERWTRVPAEFVVRQAEHSARSFAAWADARPRSDFAAVRPFLEKSVDLSREYSEFFPGYDHVADPLIDLADYGLKASTLRDLFGRLREQQVPLVRAIAAQPPADDSCLHLGFPREGQEAFFHEVVRAFGFDLERGRVDVAAHPFTTRFALDDVRFTVRYDESHLGKAIFSAFHEAGHALYELGSNPAYEGTPLAGGCSSGAHESQSRLWENVVGRSRGFWTHYYPKLQTIFPAQLGEVPLDTFYRAINRVKPSLTRVEADEVTYNLHVMIRFDLELALLQGALAVRDLPEAWNARYASDLGVAVPNDREGVMQDVHWYYGTVGGLFQGYTLGNVLNAQFYEAALAERPEIPAEIAQGKFGTLHGWLKDKIYSLGNKVTASELVQQVTGGPMRIEPYIHYLRSKYGELYQI
ncbi:MAG TPA: carboxypeptidase M32 [Anaerolineae bacterium]|nr:carboxypeptidase M32 [Anaerolineae bacterium]